MVVDLGFVFWFANKPDKPEAAKQYLMMACAGAAIAAFMIGSKLMGG